MAGRKGKYEYWITEEGLKIVSNWSMHGFQDKEIAAKIGIHVGTLCEWKTRFPEFAEAFKNSREIADLNVEAALYKSALGYTWEEVTTEIIGEKKRIRKVTKHVPPNTVAQIFWLKNRMRHNWSDNPVDDTKEEQEDDGLLDALKKSAENIWASGDDSEEVTHESG